MTTVVQLSDVAEINPRMRRRPADDEYVSFLGMAGIDAASGTTEHGETRRFGQVSKGYTNFQDGDLLLAKITPCFENGKIAQAWLCYPLGVGSTEFHVIRPNPNTLDARFALHLLRTPQVRVAGERRMTGSAGQRRVPEAYIAQLELPLPPIEEQRRTSEILDRAAAIRAKRQESITHLNDLRRSIFADMFGDPVANPRQLPVRTLNELGSLERGVSKHRPRNDPHLLGGAYPLIQTGDVANSGGIIRSFSATYSELGLRQSKLWPSGTLCITIAANIAKTGILTFPACFPDSVVGFTADSSTTAYVKTWFLFIQKALEASAPMSAQRNINLAILRELPVPVPSRRELEEFAARTARVESMRDDLVSNLDDMEELFASLQHSAFSNRLGAGDREDTSDE